MKPSTTSLVHRLSRALPALLVTLTLALSLAGCNNDGPLEEAGEKIDDAVEDAGDAVEDAVDG